MKLTIEAEPQEIAALVLAVQERQGKIDEINFAFLAAALRRELEASSPR